MIGGVWKWQKNLHLPDRSDGPGMMKLQTIWAMAPRHRDQNRRECRSHFKYTPMWPIQRIIITYFHHKLDFGDASSGLMAMYDNTQ